MSERHARSAAVAIGAGVRVLHGTDFPPLGASAGTTLAVRELELLVDAGLTSLGALRAVTLNPAPLLQLEPLSGRIGPGAPADVVAVPTNPLVSVSALRDLRAILCQGELVQAGPH